MDKRWATSTPEQKAKRTEAVSRWRREKIKKLKEMFGNKCSRCGYSRCLRALEFHHLNRKEKEFPISTTGRTVSWARLVAEAKKCVLLCANCHREVESFVVESEPC